VIALPFGFLTLFPAADAQAQPVPYPGQNPDSALAETLARIEGDPLSLDDAVRSALSQSTEAQAAAAAIRSAGAIVRRERGVFDPELFGLAQRNSADTRTASPFAGTNVLSTRLMTATAGARILLPTGTGVDLTFNATRTRTNSAFASLDPEYDTDGALTIEQPLLRGFGPGTRSELSAVEREAEGTRAAAEDVILGLRANVEATYWGLYASERNLAVQQLIRDQATALLDQARLRAKAGLVGPGEVANARVFLAEQELSVLDREEEMDHQSDVLASLVGSRPPGGIRYRPSEEPPPSFGHASQDSLVALALAENLEIRAADQAVRAAEERRKGARQNALPLLNIFGSIGGTGLAGTGRDVVFGSDTLRTTLRNGFGDAWTQVLKRDSPMWDAGIRFSIPIGARVGRGERDRLGADVEKALARRAAARHRIEEEVRSADRALASGDRRLQISRDGLDAALEQVRIGMIDYRSGRTTAFEVVHLGADLATAQQRYSQALVRAANAAAELERLTAGGYSRSSIQPDRGSQGGGTLRR
jgi:outer membrane protein